MRRGIPIACSPLVKTVLNRAHFLAGRRTSDAQADAEMAQPSSLPPPPSPPPIDVTLEELLSQFDDDDVICHRSPPPPAPPTNSLEQFDYIEELDRLLLQHDDAQRVQAQAQDRPQAQLQWRDSGLEPVELPPPEEEAEEREKIEASAWTGEEESALSPLLLLPPPDEYKDMEEVAVRPPPSLLLQALATPIAVSDLGETVDLDHDTAPPAHFESGFAGAGYSQSFERGQEQCLQYGSESLTIEPVASWSSGEASVDGEHPAHYPRFYENLHRSSELEHRTPKTTILNDLTKFRPEKFRARSQGEVPSGASFATAQFRPRSPSASPCSRTLFLPMAPPSVADTDSGVESVSSLSPPDADGEMSPMCSPPSTSTNIACSVSPKKPATVPGTSVLSSILSQEPEPTKSSTLLNSLLVINNNNATSATPHPLSILSVTDAEDFSSVDAAACSLKVLAIDPKEMMLSVESREAQGRTATSEAHPFETIDGDDLTGLSFLDGDEVPIRSALEDEEATPRLARRKRSASEIEEHWAREPKGWAKIACTRVTLHK